MTYRPPVRDMSFALNEIAGLKDLCGTQAFPDLEPDLIEQVLEESGRMAGDLLAPLNWTGDQQGARLEADGFVPEQIARIRAPVGLDIGAKTPAEIAASIIAQITEALRRPATRPGAAEKGGGLLAPPAPRPFPPNPVDTPRPPAILRP